MQVFEPNAPMIVPFCLKSGWLSKKLFNPLGVNKQIISNSVVFNSADISLLTDHTQPPVFFAENLTSLPSWVANLISTGKKLVRKGLPK